MSIILNMCSMFILPSMFIVAPGFLGFIVGILTAYRLTPLVTRLLLEELQISTWMLKLYVFFGILFFVEYCFKETHARLKSIVLWCIKMSTL